MRGRSDKVSRSRRASSCRANGLLFDANRSIRVNLPYFTSLKRARSLLGLQTPVPKPFHCASAVTMRSSQNCTESTT